MKKLDKQFLEASQHEVDTSLFLFLSSAGLNLMYPMGFNLFPLRSGPAGPRYMAAIHISHILMNISKICFDHLFLELRHSKPSFDAYLIPASMLDTVDSNIL